MNGLLYVRQLFNLSLQDLAKKISVSNQMVSMWERSKKKISEPRLLQLSALFGIPSEYFQKELSDIDKTKIQRWKLKEDIENSMVEYEDVVYDDESGKLISIPQTHYDSGAVDYLQHLDTQEHALALMENTKDAIYNVEKYGYDRSSPDRDPRDYDNYVEKNIRLIAKMIDILNCPDLPVAFLSHVFAAIKLLGNDSPDIEEEHQTVQQIYATLVKCFREEQAASQALCDEADRIAQLKTETADDDLF